MAVGYHRINSSAARAKIRAGKGDPGTQKPMALCVMSGEKVWSPSYGEGVTLEDFVSDSDKVKCRFGEYVVEDRGGSVRRMMADWAARTAD